MSVLKREDVIVSHFREVRSESSKVIVENVEMLNLGDFKVLGTLWNCRES